MTAVSATCLLSSHDRQQSVIWLFWALVPFPLLSLCASNQYSLSDVCWIQVPLLTVCYLSSSLTDISCSVFTHTPWGSKTSSAVCYVVEQGRLGKLRSNDDLFDPSSYIQKKTTHLQKVSSNSSIIPRDVWVALTRFLSWPAPLLAPLLDTSLITTNCKIQVQLCD